MSDSLLRGIRSDSYRLIFRRRQLERREDGGRNQNVWNDRFGWRCGLERPRGRREILRWFGDRVDVAQRRNLVNLRPNHSEIECENPAGHRRKEEIRGTALNQGTPRALI